MSRVEIRLPSPLRGFADGTTSVRVESRTVGDAIEHVVEIYPKLRRQLFTSDGGLRQFVGVYVNDRDMRDLAGPTTALADGDVISIVPAIAGGSEGGPAPLPMAPHPRAVVSERALSGPQLRRYSRHLLLPEVGVDGQKRLLASKVLLVGGGGLGSPLALYLTAAGVGEIGLVDFDTVDPSNLQRQVLYTTEDVGKPKLEAAARRMTDLNPDVHVNAIPGPLTSANAMQILADYDVVVDGTDNFPTRYLVNDACVLLGKPNVYGSIYRFEGQASVFDARRGPCYRCLYPEPPPPGFTPSCAEGGVLGVLPGIVGTIQATETVKLLLGKGEPLIGRLLLFDALAMGFRELRLRKDPECVLCGPRATQKELIDYPAFCGVAAVGTSAEDGDVPSVGATELQARLGGTDPPFLLDVREPGEWEIVHLPGATLIPQRELPDRLGELTSARELVVYCKSGVRSARAVRLLRDLGFTRVRNLSGGIDAWTRDVDPSLPTY